MPTLWHVLHPDQRPTFWRRDPLGYDQERVGLETQTAEGMPEGGSKHDRRQWFDTTAPGKSAAGHTFPAKLTEPERRALLEYLKTL